MLSSPRAGAVLLAVLVLSTGCSSGDEDGAGASGTDGSATASPAPSSTGRTGPPPTIDPAVLDRPEVRAVEQWAGGFARAVNRRDRSFAAVGGLVTPFGRDWMERHARSEWGRWLPGPLPVTPLEVRPVDDTRREVTACVMLSGWSWESRATPRTRSREVAGATVRLVQRSGRWMFDGMTSATVDCTGVQMRARRW